VTITALENAILAKLQSEITGVQIELFPERPSTYRLIHPVGAILIHYYSTRFGKSISGAAVIQVALVRFNIHVQMRSLRGKGSMNAYLESVRDTLTGWRLNTGGEQMYPVSEEFANEENGIWEYVQTFEIPVKHIEKELDYTIEGE
jgi:hypothetical protein